MSEMKPLLNGHDEEAELAARDAARIAAREPEMPPATADLIGVSPESLDHAEAAFNQQQHDAILSGLDSYAQSYDHKVEDMNSVNRRLANDMLKQVAKVKDEITTMWLLGAAIDSKVRSDTAFVEKSERELEKLEHHT